MLNSFIIGLENVNTKKTLIELNKNKIINIIGCLTHYKNNLEIPNQFIEQDLYKIQNSLIQNDPLSLKIYKENNFILENLMKRVSIYKINKLETKKFYLSFLNLFLDFFKKNKIKFTFFDSTPHFPVQFIIYLVSKYLKIKTIIFHRTDLSDVYILKNSISASSKISVNLNIKNNQKLIDQYIDEKNISIWQKRSSILNKRSLNKNKTNFILAFLILIEISIKTVYEQIFQLKGKKESIFFYKNIPFFKKIYFKISFIIKYQYINFYLNKVSIDPNLDSRFIYFALHFQPERSTMPEGGIFSDQFKAIKVLSKAVDNQTLIYVKEHPRQIDLYPDLRRFNFRSIKFYKKIMNLKNVKIIKTSYSSDVLVTHSLINSTITGSIGSDSIRKKQPVIIFSEAWYSNSSFCKVVSNIKSCKSAISYFSNKKIIDDSFFKISLSRYLIKLNNNSSNYIKKNNLYSVLHKLLFKPK